MVITRAASPRWATARRPDRRPCRIDRGDHAIVAPLQLATDTSGLFEGEPNRFSPNAKTIRKGE